MERNEVSAVDKVDMRTVTCTAPVNIAVIKYWGKRDEDLILPINSSLSATLHQDQLCAKTTVATSQSFKRDRMWLNGVEQSLDNKRVQNVLKKMRRTNRKRKLSGEHVDLSGPFVHICSENNFPTAAGLASSAAGYACLVYTLAQLYDYEEDISKVARLGSGSACRSVYGGFVQWNMGSADDGSDSFAQEIVPHDYWPELRVLIIVVNAGKKHTGSSVGMQTSVATSQLLDERVKVLPKNLEKVKKAIVEKDFQTFAELTMRDCNQMHAVCLDTYPPISYLTDVSRDIQRLCHSVNDHYAENRVAYTFDAGPNACIYLQEKDVSMFLSLISHYYPAKQNDNFTRGLPATITEPSKDLVDSISIPERPSAINYIIHTKVGPGPEVVTDPSMSLLTETGIPKQTCIL